MGGSPDRLVALKDLDLQRTLHVGPRAKATIMATLERDSYWMWSRNICDYSLLLGIHEGNERSLIEKAPVLAAVSLSEPPELFYMGLIDTLTAYDMRKRSEHVVKSFVHDSSKISAVVREFPQLSTHKRKCPNLFALTRCFRQEPTFYRVRFLKAISSILQ